MIFRLVFGLLVLRTVRGCGFPGAPAHSVVAFSPAEGPIAQGTVASYSCDRGFELLGPPRRICQEDGTWSPQGIPFCVLNVAGGKAPMQSSIAENGSPQKALDGRAGSAFSPETCSLTKRERTAPWWYVNLLEPYLIQVVRIDFGRSCCGTRNATIVIRVGNKRPDRGVNAVCNRFTGLLEEGKPLYFPCNPPTRGAFVSVHLESPVGEPLSICEAFVYTDQALPIERCPTFRDQPPGSTATYHGKCYIFYNRQQLTFADANRFCKERGGTLVDETNPALQGFLSWELYRRHRVDPRAQYWLGATRDPQNRANWKWVDGQDMTVSFWYLPGGNEDCARFDGTLRWLWSDTDCNMKLNFICQHQPEGCGRPEQPPNSTIIAQSFAVGSTIEYRCDPGHLIVGPVQRTCLKTGFFNEFSPSCRYLECGLPAPIPNGFYTLVNESRSYLSVVKYECDEGYTLIDRGDLVCDVDRRWNGPPPRCEPVKCPLPPTIDNGSYRIFTSGEPATIPVLGDVIEYSCVDENFVLEGENALTCMSTGLYDRKPPTCKEVRKVTVATPTPTQKPNYRLPPPLRPSSRPKSTTVTRPPTTVANVPDDNEVDLARPGDNEIPDSVNIRDQITPGINIPRAKEEQKSINAAKLNLGGIIALGVFGGFVFLAAVITTIVILVRRNQNARMRHGQRSHDSDTISSMDSSGSESRGLNRYYKRAWENLRDAPPGAQQSHQTKSSKHLPSVYRPDTLDSPNFRGGSVNEGMRDGSEMVISDAFAKPGQGGAADKKRHHHHHHHHHSHKRRQQPGYPPAGRGSGY